jgi:uncharacterized protein (DUF169 family)
MDYAEMSKKIVDILGLQYEPVAVTVIKKGERLPEGYAEPEKPVRHCQSIMRARKGEMLIITEEKEACPVGASALGIVPLPEKVKSGEFHYNLGLYESAQAASKMIAERKSLPEGSIQAVAVSPLSKAKVMPDVVVIIGTPEQIYWLIPAATTFSVGGRVTIEMATVQACCEDSTIIPLVKGNINISLGCFGCRKSTDIKPEEMLVGIPMKKLPDMVKALEKMGAGPIPKSRTK